jgi:hypothetical protein
MMPCSCDSQIDFKKNPEWLGGMRLQHRKAGQEHSSNSSSGLGVFSKNRVQEAPCNEASTTSFSAGIVPMCAARNTLRSNRVVHGDLHLVTLGTLFCLVLPSLPMRITPETFLRAAPSSNILIVSAKEICLLFRLVENNP